MTPGNTHTQTHMHTQPEAQTLGLLECLLHRVMEEVGCFRLEVSAHLIVQCSTQLFSQTKEHSRPVCTAQLILG